MAELTIEIDHWGHKELEEYLMSLNGILNIIIKNDEQLEIYLKYDSDLITPRIIKMEILLFLDIVKIPSILSFDKHPKMETSNYIITIDADDLCCDYFFKEAIEYLFEIEGIEKVESNFNEECLFKSHVDRERITINIKYNPNLISIEKIKQIELELNI